MNKVRDGEAQDQIPEEIPTNNVSDTNEDQRSSIQKQRLRYNSMHTCQPMHLPSGPVINGPTSVQAFPGNPALLHYYEAQMRDHAAAYASAAAAAAMTAAQIAADIASTNNTYRPHQEQPLAQQNVVPVSPMMFPESVRSYQPSNAIPYQNFGALHQPHPWIHAPPLPSDHFENLPSQQQNFSFTSEGNPNANYHQRRRKRHQHMSSSAFLGSVNQSQSTNDNLNAQFNFSRSIPQKQNLPSDVGSTRVVDDTGTNRSQHGQQKRGRRRRRFWKDAGSSDSGDPSHNQHNSSNDENCNRKCRRNRKMAKATGSSSDVRSASLINKKKQRQPNDDSLLGKTGVSALYEWCMKRRSTPIFSIADGANYNNEKNTEKSEIEGHHHQEEYLKTHQHTPNGDEGKRRRLELEEDFFQISVSIGGIKMGTGRGRTKTSAKHEASRRALLTLLPGVEFDEDTGILVRLPTNYPEETIHERTRHNGTTMTSLEDLAPNLAKQLAIGHSNDDETSMQNRKQRGRNNNEMPMRDSRKRQKWPHVYPGTSTTSDDEDENSYYASRGAYVCSSLLHAMVQIDERLTEPPEFSYQVSAMTNELEGRISKLKRKAGVPISATSTAIPRGSFECTGVLKLRIDSSSTLNCNTSVGSSGEAPQPRECYRLLRSSGVGGTKREARHTAAAKLLAMLFPECNGMAQVKQAAEAAREKYAASRALKQQSKRDLQFTESSRSSNTFSATHLQEKTAGNLIFTRGFTNTATFPIILKDKFLNILDDLSEKNIFDINSSGYEKKNNEFGTSVEAGQLRQLSRQQQLEEKIDLALQRLNEHDDEGRSIPEELTADDVGRTVLRRARVDDVYWIEKLFSTKSGTTSSDETNPLFETILVSDKELCTTSMRLWSSSTIVVLLCRAIAPHQDPPLGCAVLTLGFSLQKGKILRVAQLASKSHQPRERFIETLSMLAKNMECSLLVLPSKSSYSTLRPDGIQRILETHFNSRGCHLQLGESNKSNLDLSSPRDGSLVMQSLQAVKEEGEGIDGDDSSPPIVEKEKTRDKPSKRSRFE